MDKVRLNSARARNGMGQIMAWRESDVGRARWWLAEPSRDQGGQCRIGLKKVMIKWRTEGKRGDSARVRIKAGLGSRPWLGETDIDRARASENRKMARLGHEQTGTYSNRANAEPGWAQVNVVACARVDKYLNRTGQSWAEPGQGQWTAGQGWTRHGK